jgi:hypothetical protein
LRDELRRAHAGAHFDVVGFSEGGLIARAAVEAGAWNDGDALAGARRVFLIATPNLGLPPDVPPSPMGDVASKQMAPGSEFLRALNAGSVDASRYYAIAGDAIHGESDGVVGVESALGVGVLRAAGSAVVGLPHSAGWGSGAWMPCDAAVYEAIEAWSRR